MEEDGMDESFEEGSCSILQTHQDIGSGKTVQVTQEISGQLSIPIYMYIIPMVVEQITGAGGNENQKEEEDEGTIKTFGDKAKTEHDLESAES